jgi:hypothetical protein
VGFLVDSFRTETVSVLWRVPTAERLFEAELRAGCRTAAVLLGQPPERLEAIRRAMIDRVGSYADGDEFVLPIVARVSAAQAGDEFSFGSRSKAGVTREGTQ